MSRFAMVPHWVFLEPGLSSPERMTLCALAFHADREGACFPSRGTLSKETGLSVRHIARALGSLEGRGLITRERRWTQAGDPDSSLYRIMGPDLGGRDTLSLGRDTESLGGDTLSLGVGTPCHQGRDTVSLKQNQGTGPMEQDHPSSSDGSPLREDPSSTCPTEDQKPNPKPPLEGKAHDPLRDLPEAIVELWNETMAPQGHPRVLKLTTDRRKKLLARIKESSGRQTIEGWRVIFEAVREHPFFGGHRPGRNGPFHAPLDWLVRSEDNVIRLLEDVAAQREMAQDAISWEPVEPERMARC